MVVLGLLKAKITMKMYNILRQYSAIVGVLFFVVVLSVVCTYRWSTQTVAAQNNVQLKIKGLTLSPLRTELDIAPGTSLDGVLTVTNSTKKPMTVSMNAEVFSVINQQYDYAFTEESNVVKWVTFNRPEVSLTAGKSEKVMYTIGVPLSAEPGGRYISLFASTDTGLSEGGVESRQRIASLLYITVTGDVSRDGHLVSLTSPWAVFSDKSNWSVALQNTGTTHFRSRYSAKVQDLFGGKVANMTGDALILPGTVRAVSDKLPLPQWLGIYKVVYTIGLGDTPAAVKTRFMLFMPLWTIYVTIAAVIILILWLRRKRLNKH